MHHIRNAWDDILCPRPTVEESDTTHTNTPSSLFLPITCAIPCYLHFQVRYLNEQQERENIHIIPTKFKRRKPPSCDSRGRFPREALGQVESSLHLITHRTQPPSLPLLAPKRSPPKMPDAFPAKGVAYYFQHCYGFLDAMWMKGIPPIFICLTS